MSSILRVTAAPEAVAESKRPKEDRSSILISCARSRACTSISFSSASRRSARRSAVIVAVMTRIVASTTAMNAVNSRQNSEFFMPYFTSNL